MTVIMEIAKKGKLYPVIAPGLVYMESLIATGAKERPMTITIGPTTMGGKTRSIQPCPAKRTIMATSKYTKPPVKAP